MPPEGKIGFEEEHVSVFQEAFGIYKKRSQVRGQMWLETGVRRELDMIREKLNRAEAAYERLEQANDLYPDSVEMFKAEYEDALLDLMNFANFGIKKVRRGLRG